MTIHFPGDVCVVLDGHNEPREITPRYKVLGVARDAKTQKSLKAGILTGICYLAPSTLAGVGNICPMATAGCVESCLNTAGRGKMASNQAARVAKTRLWKQHPDVFEALLRRGLDALVRKARKAGLRPACRLDGTSDGLTLWAARRGILADYPMIEFYGYTKLPYGSWRKTLAANQNLTVVYSWNEAERASTYAAEWVANGYGIAAVFTNAQTVAGLIAQGTYTLPGVPTLRVVDGDDNDARFLEHGPRIVALYAKGKAKADRSGFVIR